MKSIGIVRKIDDLGRVVIPKELRMTMDLPEGTPMEIFTDNENIILRKYQPACVFCGSADNVNDFKGKKICNKCIQEMK